MFNDRLEIHNNTIVKMQHSWHTLPHGRPQRGAKIRVPPPPSSKIKHFFLLYGWPFSYFFSMWGPFWYVFPLIGGPFHHVRAFLLPSSPCGDLFATFFYLWGAFSPCEGLSAPFFSMWGAFLLS